jgi:hypothetical protein
LGGTSAALQLFFLRGEHGKERKNKDIKGAVEEALNKLVSENDSRYNRAEADYSNISSKNKGETEMKTTSKSARLTDH